MNNAYEVTKDSVEESKAAADMSDNLNTKYIVHSIERAESKHGRILYAMVSETPDGEKGRMFMRGTKVYERLEKIDADNLFPVEATFIKRGAVWEIK